MSVLQRVDAWVQKQVDAVVHEAMRRFGMTKRSVRRNAWGLCLALVAGSDMTRGKPLGGWQAIGLLIYAFCIAVQLLWVFQGYLCRTSPQAPKKQRETSTAAQFARAS